jgi:hypothetical protein
MGWFSSLFGGERERQIIQLEGDGDYDCEVVGESHYQDALSQITGGKTENGHEFACVAFLEPEPTNANDRNAVMVVIEGLKVGYLSKPHAAAMSYILKKHKADAGQADAIIVGGWSGRGGRKAEGHFGVRLDIPV